MKNMKLTPASIGTLSSFLNSRGAKNTCSLCDHTNWTIGEDFFYMSSYTSNDNAVIPNVIMVCDNCGNTMFINAVVAGLIVKETTDAGDQ